MQLNVVRSPSEELEKIRSLMFRPTSRNDLLCMLDHKVNIVTYDQLQSYDTFEQLMDPYNCCIILYPSPTDPDVGHWCCVFVMPGQGGHVEFFDSYGSFVDEVAVEYSNTRRKQIPNKLSELLVESPYADKVWWNETPFQSDPEDPDSPSGLSTATCGFWCVVRLKCNSYNENAFKKLYYDLPLENGLIPDQLVCAVIHMLYPEF